MFLFSKRQIGILLLLVFILTIICEATLSLNNSAAYSKAGELEKQEEAILAELIALNIKIDEAILQKQQLETKLQKNIQQVAVLEKELANLEGDLHKQRQKLGKLIQFIYRSGYESLMEFLLSSSDFDDFINRSYMLSIIIEQHAQIVNQTKTLQSNTAAKLQELERVKSSVSTAKLKISQNVARLQKTKADRQAFLAELRKQSSALEARLSATATQWSEVNMTIVKAMQLLSSLSQNEFTPDKVNFNLQGLQVEFTDRNINNALQKAHNKLAAAVRVDMTAADITISGVTSKTNINFSITGKFNVAPGGKEIVYIPSTFIVNGSTLQGEILKVISSNNHISWDIAGNFPVFSVKNLSTRNHTLVINLKSI